MNINRRHIVIATALALLVGAAPAGARDRTLVVQGKSIGGVSSGRPGRRSSGCVRSALAGQS